MLRGTQSAWKEGEKSFAMVKGVKVELTPYEDRTPVERDPRVPGYHLQIELECCINCHFVCNHYGLTCDLTPDTKGYQQGVSPIGKCDKYKKSQLVELGPARKEEETKLPDIC